MQIIALYLFIIQVLTLIMTFNINNGCYTALVTPFTDSLEIDWNSLDSLLIHQITGNITGIIINGTTGESPTIKNDALAILKHVWNFVKNQHSNNLTILMGIGSSSTTDCVELGIQSIPYCDGFLLVTPSYNKPSQTQLVEHFKYICTNSDIATKPIMLYNIPSRCGVDLETNTIKQITESCKNVVAIKEASGSISKLIEIRQMLPNLKIFSGDDTLVLDVMIHGGSGLISVASNSYPEQMMDIVMLCINGNFLHASKLYYTIDIPKLSKALFCESNPTPIKYLLFLQKLIKTCKMRLPLLQLNEKYHDNLNNIYSLI